MKKTLKKIVMLPYRILGTLIALTLLTLLLIYDLAVSAVFGPDASFLRHDENDNRTPDFY